MSVIPKIRRDRKARSGVSLLVILKSGVSASEKERKNGVTIAGD